MTMTEHIFWGAISFYVGSSLICFVWCFQLAIRAELFPCKFQRMDDVTYFIARIFEFAGMSLLAGFLWPVFLHEFGWELHLKPYLDKKIFGRG